jgi:hypothetical protein
VLQAQSCSGEFERRLRIFAGAEPIDRAGGKSISAAAIFDLDIIVPSRLLSFFLV